MGYIEEVDLITKEKLLSEITGHDYGHAKRVLDNALMIAEENPQTDLEILKILCLLHDIAFQNSMSLDQIKKHHIIGAKQSEEILRKINFPQYKIKKISKGILYHLRSIENIVDKKEDFYEAQVLSDADKIDGMGSVGLIRIINFCQSQKFPLFNSREDWLDDSLYGGVRYLCSYPKKMITQTGRKIANQRANVLKEFLNGLEKELYIQ